MTNDNSKTVDITLTKDDVRQIAMCGVLLRNDDQGAIVNLWSLNKIHLLRTVALGAFDLREAAERLLADVRARHPGEDLTCPHMIAMDEALSRLKP